MIQNSLILIVDNNKENLLIIKFLLKDKNYKFIEANNGKKMIENTLKYKPDLILINEQIPIIEGFKTIEEIRKIEDINGIPILMITEFNHEKNKIKAIKAGVNDFITKPFDKNELILKCENFLKFSFLNKNYISISKNKETNIPNEIALLSDLKNFIKPLLIMIRIKDYEILENFYSKKIIKKVKIEFLKKIKSFLNEELKNYNIYNINDSDFAILLENNFNDIKSIYSICSKFRNKINHSAFKVDEIEYNFDILITFSTNNENIISNTKMFLNKSIFNEKNQNDIIYVDELIDKKKKKIKKNIEIINLIKYALKNDKIEVFFQPIYDNKKKKIFKYESLVRIIDKDNNIISPFYFLNTAKQSHYYLDISKIVIEKSFKTAMKKNISISINLSPLDVSDEKITNIIYTFLKENPKIAKKITFEILEDENIIDFEKCKNFSKTVKSYNAKIAIDDFGSGYSNLQRLLELEPDYLKIDGSLIKNIHKNEKHQLIVKSIQNFANLMNIETVAEFVSNEEIFNIINKIGIDYSQGYFIDKPKLLN